MQDLYDGSWIRRNRRDFIRVAAGLGGYLTALSTLSPPLFSQARDYGPPAWIPLEELEERLERLSRQHPKFLKLEVVGKSVEGRPLRVATLTDPSIGDETKEHVLLTTLHSGIERIGPSSMLYLMHWLLSGHPLAREMLRKQRIVCLPIVNPDGYLSGSFHNKNDLDPYNSWTLEGPMEPEKNPEAMAVKRVMDELQPEVHGDMHGSILDFQGSIHADTSAAYSNVSLRPYHHEIMRLMNEAALEEGYPADWLEEDSERIFWGPELDSIRDKVWKGRPRVYAAIYCYNRYHSIVTRQRKRLGAQCPVAVSPTSADRQRGLARGVFSRVSNPGDHGQRPASVDRLRSHRSPAAKESSRTLEQDSPDHFWFRLA